MIRLMPALVLVLAMPAQGQDLSSQIDSLFSKWDRADGPGAAVAVVHKDSLKYEQGYGLANLEYNAAITPETVFMVASVSKQFTAFAIALLVVRGDIALDDNVRTYVPEMHAYDPPITIRHLVHHTSGLRDEFGLLAMAGYHMDDVITKDTILNLLYRQRRLNFEPGSKYTYCNSGYTLMAEIVERVTGQSFREWTTENIFGPLGMDHSHFRDDYTSVIPNRAQGYITIDSTVKNQPLAYASVGASGLYTTALDLVRWVKNLKSGQVGGPEVLALIQERGVLNTKDTLDYAFGLSHGVYRGTPRISHSGSHRGFKTHVVRFPSLDLAIIVLGNVEEFQPSTYALQIADLFLPDDAERLATYIGTYTSEELQSSFELAVEDGRLVMINRHGERITLTETGRDAFSSDTWYMPNITFMRTGGQITGFTASSSRTLNVAFDRR